MSTAAADGKLALATGRLADVTWDFHVTHGPTRRIREFLELFGLSRQAASQLQRWTTDSRFGRNEYLHFLLREEFFEEGWQLR
jgi:hypothetical protein